MDAVCFTVSTFPAARVHLRSLLPPSSLVAERAGESLAAALQPDPAVPAIPGTCKLSGLQHNQARRGGGARSVVSGAPKPRGTASFPSAGTSWGRRRARAGAPGRGPGEGAGGKEESAGPAVCGLQGMALFRGLPRAPIFSPGGSLGRT